VILFTNIMNFDIIKALKVILDPFSLKDKRRRHLI
jgi:hypothetical protein